MFITNQTVHKDEDEVTSEPQGKVPSSYDVVPSDQSGKAHGPH